MGTHNIIFYCVLLSFFVVPSLSQTFYAFTTFTSVNISEGSGCWTLPSSGDFCGASNTSTTSCGALNMNSSTADVTIGTLSIPAGALVTGVTLSMTRRSPIGTAYWTQLGLIYQGNFYNANPSNTLWNLSFVTDNFTTFSGKSSWTPAELNHASFGVRWKTYLQGGPGVALVWCVQVAVQYTLGSPSATPSMTPSKTPSPSRTPSPSITPSSSPSTGASTSPSPSIAASGSPSPSGSSPSSTPQQGGGIKKKKSDNTAVIIGAAAGGGGLIAIVLVAVLIVVRSKKNRKCASQPQNFELSPTDNNNNCGSTNYQAISTESSVSDMSNLRKGSSLVKRDSEMDYHIKYSELNLEKEVGRGAFGVVWKGKWRSNNVAVKKMIIENMDNKQMEDFVQEMTLMKSLRPSPNVVLLLGVCDDPLCVITEFCEAGSLHTMIHSKLKMDWPLQKKIVTGIAKGMLHLHLEGIVHRDLAARNVLLTASFEPKISDFGLSRFVAEQDSAKTTSNVGPLKWMAPECIRDREYSKASDVWAYGITLIEIFTREDPYGKMDGLSVATRVAVGQLNPTTPNNVPEQLAKMMDTFFAYKAFARPDFQTICDGLESLK